MKINLKKLFIVMKIIRSRIIQISMYIIEFVTSVTTLSPVVFMLAGDIEKLYYLSISLCDIALKSIRMGFTPVLIYILNINI